VSTTLTTVTNTTYHPEHLADRAAFDDLMEKPT
jgi:hypothetical protein